MTGAAFDPSPSTRLVDAVLEGSPHRLDEAARDLAAWYAAFQPDRSLRFVVPLGHDVGEITVSRRVVLASVEAWTDGTRERVRPEKSFRR